MEKKLFRVKEGRIFGGVCTGLGEYFNIDPVLVRLLFVILFFLSGIGILAYIIFWIIVPEKVVEPAPVTTLAPEPTTTMSPEQPV